jgi:hypothetical protein
MGSRDFQKGEKKKPKKDSKRNTITSSIQDLKPEVEVIRKGKKTKDEDI